MLNDRLLENRLNAVKEGKPIPGVKRENTEIIKPTSEKITAKQFFISEIYKIFQVVATSLLYGFGIRAIFGADWSIIEMLGVGIIANHTIFNILSILSKPFKK